MKKIIVSSILLLGILFAILITILSTFGIETNKFNQLVSEKVSQSKNINLNIKSIKFKLDIKELSLFLLMQSPKIKYKDISIPAKDLRVYIDFLSLLKPNPKIEKVSLISEELNINQLNDLSVIIKPSNFKRLLNNRIKDGKVIFEIDIFLDQKNSFKDFIAKGNVKKLNAVLQKNISIENVDFSFFADKEDILIKNVFAQLDNIKIANGDIKLNLENGIKVSSNFDSAGDLSEKIITKYKKFFNFSDNFKIKNLKADLNNNFVINFDNTYKIIDYNYKLSGKIKKTNLELLNPFKNNFIKKEINEIYFSDIELKSLFSPKEIKIKCDGKYSFNDDEFFRLNLENQFIKNTSNLKVNLDYNNGLDLNMINYKVPNDEPINLYLDLNKKDDIFKINKLKIEENNNSIFIEDMRLNLDKLLSFKKIDVQTTNNNFLIQQNKKILVKGSKFDATNVAKFIKEKSDKNLIQGLTNEIDVDFNNIKIPMSEKLENFKLIGEIKNGKFTKISAKGDFGGNNFLDISLKRDKKSKKKYLEVYSDLTRPLLTEYKFFNGLSGGKLLYTSLIEDTKSLSKLKIENFKVINASGVIKLLSLADLGGLADLAKGDGLTFDLLEIDMEKNKDLLKLNEILALGPSMSVLMEGYQSENGLTSLRGTLVPAKTLNKMISKIPVIGNIVIPKEVGEGLFGISFKMKGPEGKIKTTINPIRTLTPRFLQKIIERNNKTK